MRASLVILAALLVLAACPFVGMIDVPFAALFDPSFPGPEGEIFWKVRIPRTLAAFLAGASLSVCGLLFQTLFKNYLATPFTLGVSSGSALGAVAALAFGIRFSFLGLTGTSLIALAGAVLTGASVFRFSGGRSEGPRGVRLLLAGVVASFFLSNLILFVQFLSDFTGLFRISRWLMGGIALADGEPLAAMGLLSLAGISVCLWIARDLNLVAVGDEFAHARGVDVRGIERAVFVASSLIVAGVTSFCGPIGFVGILEPFLCRALFGHDHRVLVPMTFLVGGTFLTLCDTAARVLIAPSEIPVGVITGMLGGPFFLWMLAKAGEGRFHRGDG